MDLAWLTHCHCHCSIYPVILAANLEIFFPQLASGWTRL